MTEKKEGKDKKDAKDPKKGAKDEKDKKDPKDAKKGGKDEKKVTLDDKKKGKDEKTKSSSDEGKIKDKKGKKDAKKGKGRRHKKKKPEPVEPIKMPRWYEWCEKNSKPKRWYYPRQRMEPTRWQKRGPMKAKQWKQFFKWAAEKAEPRKYSFEKPPPPPELDAKGRPIVEPPPEPIDYEAQLARATELAQPVRPREKYQYPKKPKYPYRPTFDQRFPAKPERGRPFKPPAVPAEFQHWLIELEFWETVRFPISKAALKAVASQRTKELAQPRELPKVPHCPLPPPPEPEYIPPRTKMTMKQWRGHLRRLQYLAKPNVRPLFYHC